MQVDRNEDFRVLGKVLWENWGYVLPDTPQYMGAKIIKGLKAEGYEIKGIETEKDPD
jgi:hypothetical protein